MEYPLATVSLCVHSAILVSRRLKGKVTISVSRPLIFAVICRNPAKLSTTYLKINLNFRYDSKARLTPQHRSRSGSIGSRTPVIRQSCMRAQKKALFETNKCQEGIFDIFIPAPTMSSTKLFCHF